VWGSAEGFVGGKVLKVQTHAHDEKNHTATIEWLNGTCGEFRGTDLLPLNNEEHEYSQDYLKRNGAMPKDVFILLRTTSGRYVLNVIESIASHSDTVPSIGCPRYTTMITKHALPDIPTLDAYAVGKALSFPDLEEKPASMLFGAYAHWFNAWGITVPRSVYGPLPTIKSLIDAKTMAENTAAAAGPCAGRYAFFHLPSNLCDYSVLGSS
jgi:hypothetical protein